jgi:hypothetical protein
MRNTIEIAMEFKISAIRQGGGVRDLCDCLGIAIGSRPLLATLRLQKTAKHPILDIDRPKLLIIKDR